MAFNISVFKTRAKTALIYAVVMLTGLLWNEWSFFVLFTVVHFGCWYEFQKLSALIDPTYKQKRVLDRIVFPLFGWSFMIIATMGKLEIMGVHLHVVGLWLLRICLFLLPAQLLLQKNYSYNHFLRSMTGVIYVSVSLALLISLRSGWIWGFKHEGTAFPNAMAIFSGKIVVILVIVSIWINDTMAYIVGSFVGKTPLTSWSPKKTWEGTIGGVLLSVGVAALVAYLAMIQSVELIVLVAAAAISGTIGDLVESKFKRLANVKDSGNFMPGHGGFLDRFDSILFAAPVVWLICYFLYR
jgi:phosphatidate cytidylyltransferase